MFVIFKTSNKDFVLNNINTQISEKFTYKTNNIRPPTKSPHIKPLTHPKFKSKPNQEHKEGRREFSFSIFKLRSSKIYHCFLKTKSIFEKREEKDL